VHKHHTFGYSSTRGDVNINRLDRPEDLGPSRAEALAALRGIGLIYAIWTPSGQIKIGYTENIWRRRRWLGGEVIAFMPGNSSAERAIHARLVDHRHHGREWYYPTPGVLAVVNEMREALGNGADRSLRTTEVPR
jgi:hypothetical protein